MRRWLAGGTPYARHRAKLARALDTNERQLWPHLADTADAGASASVAEALTGFTHADAPGAPSTETLLSAADHQIDLLADASHNLLAPIGLSELLLAKARDGCQVRILVCEPDGSLTALLAVPGIEIRRSEIQERPIIHRVDDDSLAWVTLTTAEETDQPPMLLHIRRDQAPGMFDRLADHYEDAWKLSEPIQTASDIEHYFVEVDGDSEDADDDEGGPPPDHSPTPPPAAPPAAEPVSRPAASPPRRWPGRPA